MLNCAKNRVLLLDILVGLSVVNVSGMFLYRLSLCKLLYIFLFLLFSLFVTLYCVNLRLIIHSKWSSYILMINIYDGHYYVMFCLGLVTAEMQGNLYFCS